MLLPFGYVETHPPKKIPPIVTPVPPAKAELPNWDSMLELYQSVREIERAVGALPLPSNIHARTHSDVKVEKETTTMKRWYKYSRIFRSTVTQSGVEE